MSEVFAVWEGDIDAQHSLGYDASTVLWYTVRTVLRLRLPLTHTLSLSLVQHFLAGPDQSKSPSGQRRLLPTRRSKIACCSSHSLQARVSCVSAPPQLVSLERMSASAPQNLVFSPWSLSSSVHSRTLHPSSSRRRFFSTTPHRSSPICNPLVRRHPVAFHGPARLFHYHATPIISFLSPTCPPHDHAGPHPLSCRPTTLTRDIRSPRVCV